MIGYVWPEPQSSAAGLRDWNLIETLLQAQWNVSYISPSAQNAYSQRLQDLGIHTSSFLPNDPRFDQFIQELQPDYVIFDRFVIEEQFGWRVKEHCPQAIRVLDTQDLHFLRRNREKALKAGKAVSEIAQCQFDLISDDTLRELGSIYRSDCSLLVSSFEKQLLMERFSIPHELLFLHRFHYDNPPSVPSFHEREDFMMIGNFRHPPNADGILWIRSEIWPLIRQQLPTAKLYIYGAYPPREMMNLSDKKIGFNVMGPVSDQFETLKRHRVNLAPLRFGAGIKGKISDGWWSGTPVITTSIGSEGMAESLPWGGEVEDQAMIFAQKAVDLYSHEASWVKAQENGFRIIQKLYNKANLSQEFMNLLAHLKENRTALRNANVVGSILGHHLYKSTKYFSKWIEEKNKRPQGP